MWRSCRREAWVVAAFALSACAAGESDGGGDELVVFDSAGVTIVDHGVLDPERRLTVGPGPAVRIGTADGDPAGELYQVGDVKRLGDGAIAVANGGTREVKIFEPDGTHRVTIGGSGQGPSEFGYPIAIMVRAGDTLQVQDRLDRVFFTATGDFVGRETTERSVLAELAERVGGMSEGGQWLADGTWFAPFYDWNRNPPQPGPLFRPEITVGRVAADFTELDTLGVYGGIEQQYVDIAGGRVSATVPPFASSSEWGLSAGDGTIVVGDNAMPRFERFGPDGSRTVVRWRAEPVSGTPAEVEAWKERQRNASWVGDRIEQLERAWAVMDIPEVKPFYGRVRVGSDGAVWLGSADDWLAGTTLRAFAPDGAYLGTVELPGQVTIHDSGPGWILGVARDDFDVETVVFYEVGGG